MFFTNKEKEALLKKIEELEIYLKREKNSRDNLHHEHAKEKKILDLRALDKEITFAKDYIGKLSKKQQEHYQEMAKLESDCRQEQVKASKLETENSVLKAELDVLRKLEDKSDEYTEAIHSLELQIADKQARIQLMNEKSIRDEKEIIELKAQLKEANDRIFTITTKEPIIVRPEVLTPAVIEPTILSSKK